MNELFNLISEKLAKMYDFEFLPIYNAYCEETGCYDDRIYPLTDNYLNDVILRDDPAEILKMINGNFNYFDKYFCFSGNRITSFNDYSFIDVDSLVNWLIEYDRYEEFKELE